MIKILLVYLNNIPLFKTNRNSYKESDCNSDMKNSMPDSKIVETNYKKFILPSKNKENNNSPKIVILLKNHYSNIWNSWANRLAQIFLLLSKD
jgi:hypothetical protein